ncbi:MAG: response regulator transcription factor [Phycisphaerae bacterium]|nr:response regulator transcription factor [Phycisphaerae bacterium]
MQQFPRPAAGNIAKTDFPYERPKVVLLDDKHWSYIQRRYHISPRELEVAKLVCDGLSNKEIAEALNIRQGTVKTHMKNLYRRIHVKNKVALLLRFMADVSKLLGESPNGAVVPITDTNA